jgi:hypothetical protein
VHGAGVLLQRLADPLATPLARVEFGGLKASMRHESILVHGYAAMGARDVDAFHRLLHGLQELLEKEDPGNRELLRLARHEWLD